MRLAVTCSILLLTVLPVLAQDSMNEAKQLYSDAKRAGTSLAYSKAIVALKKAVTDGFGEAAYLLGDIYLYGYPTDSGKKENCPLAYDMYKKGIELGYEKGEVDLGRMCLYGWGVEKNEELAYQFFTQAMNRGILEGRFFVALCRMTERGVESTEDDWDFVVACVKKYHEEMGKHYDNLIKNLTANMLALPAYRDYFNYNDWQSIYEACEIWLSTNLPVLMMEVVRYMYVQRIDHIGVNGAYKVILKTLASGLEDKEKAEAYYIYANTVERIEDAGGLNSDYELECKRILTKENAMTKAAELGYPLAFRDLANWYSNGKNVSKNLVMANKWREKADNAHEDIDKEIAKFDNYSSIEYVNKKAIFPGGRDAYIQFVRENRELIEDENGGKITGKASVQVVVRKDGSIAGARVLECDHPALGKELLRITNKMPPFIPGEIDGKVVWSRQTLSWTFN